MKKKIRNSDTKGYLIGVDLDGIICWQEGGCWSAEDALKSEPIQKNIDLLLELIHAGNHIIIHTARKEWWRAETEAWLLKNEVPYHALVMGKTPCDAYWDDKNIDFKGLKKLL